MKPLVIKIGGSILEKPDGLTALLNIIATMNNHSVVIVHGGGCVVDDMLKQAGFDTQKKNGLRITPKAQMPIICGALAGNVNKSIVAKANSLQLNAVGLSLADGNLVKCILNSNDLGAVGQPNAHQSALLDCLLKADFLPIISSIGALDSGELVNVNADDAAVSICQLLNAELLLLTDVNGVKDKDGNCLSTLTEQDAKSLIQCGIISGGMTAKVTAAFQAANQLRRSIAVASWQAPEQIQYLLAGANVGTRIIPSLAV